MFLDAGLTAATWRSYTSAIRTLAAAGVRLPLSRIGFVQLLQLASSRGWSAATLQLHIAAVRRAHRDLLLPPPPTEDHWARQALRGYQVRAATITSAPPRRKLPLPACVADLCLRTACDPTQAPEVRLAATGVAVGFFFMLRGASICAVQRTDCSLDSDTITFRIREKTRRTLPPRQLALRNDDRQPLCQAFQWSLSDDAPRPTLTSNVWGLKNNTVIAQHVRTFAELAGLPNPRQFAASSLRPGGATAMAAAGIPWAEIKAIAGWSERADTHTRYLRPADAVAPDRDSLVARTILFLRGDTMSRRPA